MGGCSGAGGGASLAAESVGRAGFAASRLGMADAFIRGFLPAPQLAHRSQTRVRAPYASLFLPAHCEARMEHSVSAIIGRNDGASSVADAIVAGVDRERMRALSVWGTALRAGVDADADARGRICVVAPLSLRAGLIRAILAGSVDNSSKIWALPADSGTKSAKLGVVVANSGAMSANLGQIWPLWGRSDFGRIWPALGRFPPTCRLEVSPGLI